MEKLLHTENLAKPLKVGDLARKTGKTVRALHLYEELGLLHPVHRSKGGFRLYAPTSVARVAWIQKLQDAGFSLTQVQTFLRGFGETPVGSHAMESVRETFEQKLAETREQIERLTKLEGDLIDSIAYLNGCKSCAPVRLTQECPSCQHQGHADREQPLLVAGIHRG